MHHRNNFFFLRFWTIFHSFSRYNDTTYKLHMMLSPFPLVYHTAASNLIGRCTTVGCWRTRADFELRLRFKCTELLKRDARFFLSTSLIIRFDKFIILNYINFVLFHFSFFKSSKKMDNISNFFEIFLLKINKNNIILLIMKN